MLGLLINDNEQAELEYVIKRELEELLLDLEDSRIDQGLKHSMQIRYKRLFQLLTRVANDEEVKKYIPQKVMTE
ncbi:hypothetical protein J416_03711 [Gracilibacillus halophilus YIM-C55.5]|uniref:Uncharacterized protein n=1 Tax=Gracilibacillus halophilus YIM-C55.5 TaxID=1308866 RepID=N4WTZ4_9BACI|nr:hypothetical protein [Gracilibacillus halophilus]ENH97835.1 hypothetical protein J416_03711 [Gracilibacillus halophilus YIM-C55.5]